MTNIIEIYKINEDKTNHFRACSVSSQSMWIEWDWMGLNPKQVKPLLIFFPIPSNPCVLEITEQALSDFISFPVSWN
jgi:hypothetical protein